MELTPKTRKEVFLAAAGGQDVTTPTPITREEVFLNEIVKGGGGSSLPSTETASAGDVLSLDDNKEPQWATPSGGGGVLVVHDVDGTLDKTWQEIRDADFPVVVSEDNMLGMKNFFEVAGVMKGDVDLSMTYGVVLYNFGSGQTVRFSTSSASGYPAYTE